MSCRYAAIIAALIALSVACSAPAKEPSEPKEPELDAETLASQGAAAEQSGDVETAEKKYRKAIRLEPSSYEINSKLVDLLVGEGRGEDAVEAAEAFAAAAPDDLRANHLLADAYLVAGNYRAAAKAMSELLALEDDAAAYEKRARARVLGGDLGGGEQDYRKALELQPDNIEHMVGLGSVLIRRGARAQAKEYLAAVLDQNSEHPRANMLMGVILRDAMELDDALKHHLRAVRVDPEYARAHFELGITHNLRGDNIAAEASLARAVKLEPNDGINWYAYGEALRLLGKFSQALAPYRRAVELMPEHKKAPNKLGYVLFKLGKYNESEVVLTAAVRKNPDDPYAYFNLGMVYAKGEKLALAINAFRRFLELAPEDDRDIPVARKKIRTLTRQLRRRR